MTKHDRILSIIIFILLAFVLYKLGQTFLKERQAEQTRQEEIKKQALVVDMSFVSEIPITTESKYATVSGAYPQFRNADPSFNDRIRNAIFITQSEFENNTKINWQARYDTKDTTDDMAEYPSNDDKFTFMIQTEYVQVNANFISALVTIAAYSGGAHGYEISLSFNYDVKQGKEMTMADLFPNDTEYLTKVSNYSRKDLLEQFTKNVNKDDFESESQYQMAMESTNSMIIPGTEPKVENFSVFTFLPELLNIHFAQYQVAAYVYGAPTVKMPLE